ncbi:hypothetical protein Nepgr_022174 [Nepenthes gracilis]|uniref:EamA domain-containing protein n=1 Tax=Nepenthes gracilis TaxID=150966 RepID=A0AAD3SZX0_NEPGR|nr:hypothetical protein Nepgr_022174 [Nepenthes gracilis]
MASAFPYSWPWRTTSNTLIKFSFSSSSYNSFNFNFSRKSFHLTTYSLAYCSPCCSSSKKIPKNPSKKGKLIDDTLGSCHDYSFPIQEPVILEGNANSRTFSRSIASIFRNRSLWRRIFFTSKRVRSIILLNVLTFVYATNIPVVKEAEATMDPAAFSFIRFALSAFPFVPFVFRSRNDAPTRKAGIELGLWVSLGYLMQALGLLTSDAGRASFISMLTVIVVPVLDGILGAKWIASKCWRSIELSKCCVFGVHMLRTERISRITKKENFLPLLGYEVCVMAFSSMMWYVVGGCCRGALRWDPKLWTWELFCKSFISVPWIPAIYTGIFSSGLCLWMEMSAMCDVSATETAIIYGLEPVWGAGFAWFLLGERWGVTGWMGAALILVGSLTVQIAGSLPPSKPGEDE